MTAGQVVYAVASAVWEPLYWPGSACLYFAAVVSHGRSSEEQVRALEAAMRLAVVLWWPARQSWAVVFRAITTAYPMLLDDEAHSFETRS